MRGFLSGLAIIVVASVLTSSPSGVACIERAPTPHLKGEKTYQLPLEEMEPQEICHLDQAGDVADWGHKNIGVPDAWKHTKGEGVIVAILDTGCDFDHGDLAKQILAYKDFTGSRSGANDLNGHGTHCAGVVAAAENGMGMIGVAPGCKLLIGKVLGDRGSGSSVGIAQGIHWAVDQGANVISMSLGGDGEDDDTKEAVKYARSKGVIVVAAAGNSGPGRGDTIGFPGGYPEVVCVGATDKDDKVASFSSWGRNLTVCAPGVGVRSCYPGNRFATMSGTSMATPYVAGVAALYVADSRLHFKKPTPEEFVVLLGKTARDLPPTGRDTATGYGLIQPGKMVGLSVVVPPPKKDEPPAKKPGDVLEIVIPPEFRGRPIKKIVIEFESVP